MSFALTSKRIDFFVVGAQKSGTTALSRYLMGHKQVIIPERKELHFFDNDDIDWTKPDYGILHAHYGVQPGSASELDPTILWGEATPIYMFWPNAIKRIHDYNPDAKLIVCLRHPSFRAYSHWRMEFSRGKELLPFRLAISDFGRARINKADPMSMRIYTYIERGFYFDQITLMRAFFPPNQISYIRSDHLIEHPGQVLKHLARFLEIHEDHYALQRLGYVSPVDYDCVHSLGPDDKKLLDQIYLADITRLSLVAKLDLQGWLDPLYAEAIIPKC